MSRFSYGRLSPVDFEYLAADVLNQREGVIFERFAEGPDSGIDLRYQPPGHSLVIAQAKRVMDRSELKRQARSERVKLQRLNPARYLLVTSCALTPHNKAELHELLAPWLKAPSDIISGSDLDGWLGSNPHLLRRHVKLWLQDAEQLESILHSAIHRLSQAYLSGLQRDLVPFVHHDYVEEIDETLARYHCCLITGAPGVGKTTLAGYLALRQAAETGHELHAFVDRQIKDVWSILDPTREQLFILDDFLGANFLQESEGLALERQLIELVRAVSHANGKHKLLLTTRDYVLHQACWRLERLGDATEELGHVTVDIQRLSSIHRARLLHSHLFHAGLPSELLTPWIRQREYHRVIQHRNFNPRLIAAMAGDAHQLHQGEFGQWLIQQLDNPGRYWEKAFRKLGAGAQHFLYVLALTDQQAALEDLTTLFHCVHMQLMGGSSQPDALREAMTELEPNFIVTHERAGHLWCAFANPGVADTIFQRLAGHPAAQQALWQHVGLFQHAVWLFKLLHPRQHFCVLSPCKRNQLEQELEKLVDLLDAPARRYAAHGRVIPNEGWVSEVQYPDWGARLVNLWILMQGEESWRAHFPSRIEQKLPSGLNWCEVFEGNDYDTLLDFAGCMSRETRELAWQGALEAFETSEQALALVRYAQAQPEAAAFYIACREELEYALHERLDEELQQADDDDYVSSWLDDVQHIDGCLGLDMSPMKASGYERLEMLRDDSRYEEGERLEQHHFPDRSPEDYETDALFRGLLTADR
ncbi:hypothetical protein [Halomonas sp. NO4]|uniref:nSTAND3 domain-containing NTPase n=1 Tax=Halomonas sp. NO4 TaxID=2484813 RepID=UPI0013D11D8B|nr:hypothetical protein [Halomonas sp. NO4]